MRIRNKKEDISIFIYLFGDVVATYTAKNREDAKKIYYKNASNAHAYTQLVVNGIAFNTARAERYLGMNRVEPLVFKKSMDIYLSVERK